MDRYQSAEADIEKIENDFRKGMETLKNATKKLCEKITLRIENFMASVAPGEEFRQERLGVLKPVKELEEWIDVQGTQNVKLASFFFDALKNSLETFPKESSDKMFDQVSQSTLATADKIRKDLLDVWSQSINQTLADVRILFERDIQGLGMNAKDIDDIFGIQKN